MATRFFQNTIALVYDFDGTLSPQPMQEYTVLPKIGVDPPKFWAMVNREARETESDPMLVYMRHIIEALEREKVDVKRADFATMARAIKYFPGRGDVVRAHERVRAAQEPRQDEAARTTSSPPGQKEILEGASIRKHFKQIYASEYHFNHHGVATFPKLLVTDTLKTQFLFRINKGTGIGHRVDQRAHARERAADSLPEHDLRGRRDDRRAVDGAHEEERRAHGRGVRRPHRQGALDVREAARRGARGLHRRGRLPPGQQALEARGAAARRDRRRHRLPARSLRVPAGNTASERARVPGAAPLSDGRFHSGEDIARSLGPLARDACRRRSRTRRTWAWSSSACAGKGYRLAEPIEFLDAGVVASMMGPVGGTLAPRGRRRGRFDQLAAARAGGGRARRRATCLAAEWQSAGRGRRGRSWVGGLGGIAHVLAAVALRARRGPSRGPVARGGRGGRAGAARVRRGARAGEVAQRRRRRLPQARRHPRRDQRRDAGAERRGGRRGHQLPAAASAVVDAIDQPVTDVAPLRGRASPRATCCSRACSPSWSRCSTTSSAAASPPSATSGARCTPTTAGACASSRRASADFDADVVDVADDGTLLVAVGGTVRKLSSAELIGVRPHIDLTDDPILAIDAGNTRIKWGVHEARAWKARGISPTTDASQHRAAVERRAQGDAGDRLERGGRRRCARASASAPAPRAGVALTLIRTRAEQLGVTNGYRDPRAARDRSLGRAGGRAPRRCRAQAGGERGHGAHDRRAHRATAASSAGSSCRAPR